MGMVHIDRQIAIWAGWIATPAFGVAMMAAPEYLKLDPPYSRFLFWGGLIIFFVTIVVVVALSLHDDRVKKKVVGPILTMALGALILGGGIAWYFWPARDGKPSNTSPAQLSSEPTLQSRPQEKAMAPASIPTSPMTAPIAQNIPLSNEEKKQLIQTFIVLKPTIKSIMINRSSSTKNNLWMELVDVFNRAGFGSGGGSVQTGFQQSANPDETGVMICTIDINAPSKIDAMVKDALEKIGIKSKYIPLSESIYKGDITIFVGHDPL